MSRHASPGEAFTPTRPRAGRRRLVGRRAELDRLLGALNDEASHAVIYAERGRGKTSLTNLAVERLRSTGATVGRYVCNAESNFDQIMHGLVADLPAALRGGALAQERGDALALEVEQSNPARRHILPAGEVQPTDVARIPERLVFSRLIFVVDEFDRVVDDNTRTKLADTLKLLSDRGTRLYFLIVGVSDTLDKIIGQHPSIQRNIAAVHLPLFEDAEIRDVLVRGGQSAGIDFTEEAIGLVVGIARGMPYMAQLMGLRIAQQTLSRGAKLTSSQDVEAAVARLLDEDSAEIGVRFSALMEGPDGPELYAALKAAVAARQDRWGRCLAGSLSTEQRTLLTRCKIYEASAATPSMLQPVDRPLIYHHLLLESLPRPTDPRRSDADTDIASLHTEALHGV